MNLTIYNNKIGFNVSVLIFILILVGTFIGLFYVPFSHDDSGYYFKYAQEIVNGQNGLLYRDIKLNYTPLPMFLYSLVFIFYKDLPPNYSFLFINYLFILGSTLLIYKILNIFRLKRTNIFLALSIYLLTLNSIGTSSTEHFVVFFELFMVYFLLRSQNNYHLIISGISAFLAFYSKQYGIISIFMGLMFFIYPQNKLSKIKYFIIGLLMPNLLLYLYYFIYGNGFSFVDLYSVLLFPKKESGVLTGEGYNLIEFIVGFIQFLLVSLYLIPTVVYYFKKKVYTNGVLNYVLIFIALNMSQFIITSAFHYYLLILPFVVIISCIILNDFTIKNKFSLSILVLFILFSFASWSMAFIRIKKINNIWQSSRIIKEHPNCVLESACKSLNKIIPRGSKVFIEATMYFYYPADFYSLDIKHLGYTWAQQHNNVNEVIKYFDSGEYLMTHKNTRFKEYPQFVENVAMKSKDYEVFTWFSPYPVGNKDLIYIVHKK